MTSEKEIKELIEKVAQGSNKSVAEIKVEMEEKKKATHGLLTDYGAIYGVAKKYRVDLSEPGEVTLIKIGNLKPMTSANVVGRVKIIYPQKTFVKKDGREGKIVSVIIMDDTGEARVAFWDETAEITEKIKKNDVLLMKNCNIREGMRERTEIHVGAMTTVAINPKEDYDLPEIKKKSSKIGDLSPNNEVDLVCRVNIIFPKTEFQREDGSVDERRSFIAEDESGTARVVLWGVNAGSDISQGDIIKIEGGYVKENVYRDNKTIEIHVGGRGRIMKTDAKMKLPEIKVLSPGEEVKISDIGNGMNSISFDAMILQTFEPRVYGAEGKGKVSSMTVGDETGAVRVVLWNEKADVVSGLKRGDAVRIKNAYTKQNMDHPVEVHIGKAGEVAIDPKIKLPAVDEIEGMHVKEKIISDLTENDANVKIKGKITDFERAPSTYMTCPECKGKVYATDDAWVCDNCGGDIDPAQNLVVSFIMSDKSGSIRAIAFRDTAEKIIGMDVEEFMNSMGEYEGNPNALLSQMQEELVNKELTLVGRVKHNSYSDQIEFIVNSVNLK